MTTPQTQSSPPLPPTMPVLTGRDICRQDYGMFQQHCLLGWIDVVARPERLNQFLYSSLRTFIGGSVADFSDSLRNTVDVVAAKWNAWAASLGYVLSPDKSHFILPTPTTGEEKQRDSVRPLNGG